MIEQLPGGVIARIDVTEKGVRVNLRHGMHSGEFAEMLRVLADAFEDGSIKRVDKERT
jgi:hypothetical protein